MSLDGRPKNLLLCPLPPPHNTSLLSCNKSFSPQNVLDFATVSARPIVELQRGTLLQSCDTVSKLTNSSAVTARPQEGNRACFMSDLHILSASPHLACVNAHEKARAQRPQINRLEWNTRETRRTNKEPKQTCSCFQVVEKQ